MSSFKEFFAESQQTKITDFVKARNIERSFIGYACIAFRKGNDASRDVNLGNNYVLNSLGDGWFRIYEGNAKGYGLCVRTVKLTSKNPVIMGNFMCYKAQITYLSANKDSDDGQYEKDNFWVTVHKDFDIQEVLTYIETHKKDWKP